MTASFRRDIILYSFLPNEFLNAQALESTCTIMEKRGYGRLIYSDQRARFFTTIVAPLNTVCINDFSKNVTMTIEFSESLGRSDSKYSINNPFILWEDQVKTIINIIDAVKIIKRIQFRINSEHDDDIAIIVWENLRRFQIITSDENFSYALRILFCDLKEYYNNENTRWRMLSAHILANVPDINCIDMSIWKKNAILMNHYLSKKKGCINF